MKRCLACLAPLLFAAPIAHADTPLATAAAGALAHLKTTTASNGWVYAALGTQSNGTGGVTILRSTDGGANWSPFAAYSAFDSDYNGVDLVVSGNDEASLVLDVAVVKSPSGPTSTLTVDRYDGASGTPLGTAFTLFSTTHIKDVAIASDYRKPGVGTSPYSVAIAWSRFTPSQDEIGYAVSTDGGATYATTRTVAGTSATFGRVALAYGRSASGSNGRYYVAWERFAAVDDVDGSICESRNTSTITSAFITPVTVNRAPGSSNDPCTPPGAPAPTECNAGSDPCPGFPVVAATEGACRAPSIAVQYSDVDNPIGSNTTLVTATCDRAPGLGNVVGFYNMRGHYTNFWGQFAPTPVGSGDERDAHVVYDDHDATFLLTYVDRAAHALVFKSNGFEFAAPNAWTLGNANYADLVDGIDDAAPRAGFAPRSGLPNFAWIRHAAANDVAYFDRGDRIFADGLD